MADLLAVELGSKPWKPARLKSWMGELSMAVKIARARRLIARPRPLHD